MERAEALEIVREYVKNENLVRHMLAVEAAMRFYAGKFSEDTDLWGVTGLLHDFDWEIHPTLEEHPQAGAPILRAARRAGGDRPRHPEPRRPHRCAAPQPDGKSAVCLRRNHRPGDSRGPGPAVALPARFAGFLGKEEVERQSLRGGRQS